ncbi:hypothetical protein GC089_18015 [Cellulomonas sp. JZ18]|uniref:hypothetical protein n=1 Tax=Cellulomonas sp. JZ18 TaxID=2654191 RepID=UPI0012D3F7B1|nr:hypothetical protein [Cellulomonas sp. JZ18]QGQ20739.1 hypothetical protein GC089_18015 [Cellulomonas sp. JZ18]
MTPRTSTTGSSRRAAAVGLVAVTLTVGAAGLSDALTTDDRPSAGAAAGDGAAGTDAPATADTLAAAEEYTQERADAFWGADYVLEDAFALAELWDVDVLEAKARAGQMLLDGQPVPIAPGSSLDLTDPETVAQLELVAFWDAGYTSDDGAALAALWDVDVTEAKATAGRMLREGQPLPIGPSGTPVP